MGWFVVSHRFSVLLELLILDSQSEENKNLETLLLGQQWAIYKQRGTKPKVPKPKVPKS